MYLPARHRQSDPQAIHALIRAHALGMLVTQDDGLPDADHLPFTFVPAAARPDAELADRPRDLLRAHVARANPLWRRAGQAVLVVFRGPDGYVTPDRHQKIARGGRVVPTWDYHAVHVHGTLRALDDPAWMRGFLHAQTAQHEAGQPHPWSVADAPPEYIEDMLRALVGIEIAIERIEAKWKGAPPAPAEDCA